MFCRGVCIVLPDGADLSVRVKRDSLHVYAAEAPALAPPTVAPREGTWEVPTSEFMDYIERYQQEHHVDLVLQRVGKGGRSWQQLSADVDLAIHLAAQGGEENLRVAAALAVAAAETLTALDSGTAAGGGPAAGGSATGGGDTGGGTAAGGGDAAGGAAAGAGARPSRGQLPAAGGGGGGAGRL